MSRARKRKRELVSASTSENASAAKEKSPNLPPQLGSSLQDNKARNTCTHCRRSKIKCEYVDDSTSACQKCIKVGLADTCTPAPVSARAPRQAKGGTQARSQKPSSASQTSASRPSGQQPVQRQGTGDTTHPPTKRRRSQPLDTAASESSRTVPSTRSSNHQDSDAKALPKPSRLPAIEEEDQAVEPDGDIHSFATLITAGSTESELEEEFSFDDDDDKSSDDMDEDSDSSDDKPSRVAQKPEEAVVKLARKKPGPKPKSKPASKKLPVLNTYDPSTHPFTIQAAVKAPDGSNTPFKVESSWSFDKLRTCISERLNCYPGLLQLRYRLDTDKRGMFATSIHNLDEFELFMSRMRAAIVPPKLANGSMSNRVQKIFTVVFEDATAEPIAVERTSTGKNSTKQSKSSKSRSTTDNLVNDPSRENRLAALDELQTQWRCQIHSGYCWKTPEGLCYELTHQDMGFWAVEICEKRTTVKDKPETLALHRARPRSRAPAAVAEPDTSATHHHGCHDCKPMLPPNYPYVYPGIHPLPGPEVNSMSNVEYPDIISWCNFLDSHKGRNQDGVRFTPYGEKLKKKGFIRLSQLNKDYFSIQEFASWLGLEEKIGTALLILQHAKTDMDAIRANRLFIPSMLDQ